MDRATQLANTTTTGPGPSSRPGPSQSHSLHVHLVSAPTPAQPVSTPPAHHRPSESPFRFVRVDTASSSSSAPSAPSRSPMPAASPASPISPQHGGGLNGEHRIPFRREVSEYARQPLTRAAHMHPATDPSRTPLRTPLHRSMPRPMPILVPTPAQRPCNYTRPRGLRIMNLLKPFLPILAYGATSLGFVIVIAFWKSEVFNGLDDLSHWLREEPIGYLILFGLIVITTVPPVPLYSTLIILSGYTFGAIQGAVLSYLAALFGAVVVFLASRYFFREAIACWLTQTITIKRVVRAIEKRPTLLFLIRLAPYPYNVMNCLLAASPTLTFKTYTVCTALSLFKVIIHTSIGASIHSFAGYHLDESADKVVPSDPEDDQGHALKQGFTIFGIALCIAILVYLSYVARKAVDEELDDEPSGDDEEQVAFLRGDSEDQPMVERARHPGEAPTSRPSSVVPDRFETAGREEASIGLM